MKNILVTITLLITTFSTAIAAHITGGEMIYEYVGPGAGNSKRYKITLRLFRDNLCTGCAGMPDNVWIGVFNNDNGLQINPPNTNIDKIFEGPVNINSIPECVNNAPPLNYNVAYYEFTIELQNNISGYTASYQTCCRVNPLVNVFNSGGGGGTGVTYSCVIPGTSQLPATAFNNSPQFLIGIDLICHNKSFSLNFSAEDLDGDSLVYKFCEAFGGGPATNANNINPSPPPYASVPYINGFSSSTPLGDLATIDPKTGIISGVAPDVGKYVVCVCIDEYRQGVLIGTHRKDFIINVAACDFAGAQLLASYPVCDDFTQTFENLNTSSENHTFFWDFGVTGVLNDTSNLQSPTFTYPDTGVYIVKLIVNRGQACSDSTTSIVRVYPGFFPGFTVAGICVNKPTQFRDTTSTRYGFVNSWRWDFGVPSLLNDTSRLQNPTYTYANVGVYRVSFTVTSSKGCVATVEKDITIYDRPPLSVAFKDTLICVPDAVQLQAIGGGVFSWAPAVNIINANTATPTVNPTSTTKYYVTLNDNGCINTDSVNVRVVTFVTLNAFQDTTICSGDSARLGASTNGLSYLWSGAAPISSPTLLRPYTFPINSTTYQIIARIGSCSASDFMTVNTVPYPQSNAGPDTTICFNTTAQLQGSIVGSSFSWSPQNILSSANVLNPIATPFLNITPFILTVNDTLGCPKPKYDTVLVTMWPKILAFAGNDTLIVQGQPLQLQASGGELYLWSPPTALNSTNISNPVSQLPTSIDSIRYKVIVTEANCSDSAYINVKVFKTAPQVFVPTGFTPNGDGKNDRIRPIAVGIKKIEYFRIYNRWGQLVFSTSVNGQGWDGRIGGRDQGSNAFVWMVKAIDYLDRPFFKKGTVTLIR